MEQWKEVPGYEGLYLVSDKGDIYSLPRNVNNGRGKYVRPGQLLKPGKRGKGKYQYLFVRLSIGNETNTEAVHRIVAKAFLEKPMGLNVINHKDHNPMNNSVKNLEWCNQQYNNEYGHNKRICQLLNGEKIAEYKSVVYASKITGIKRTSISNALNGWSETAGGYNWKYCE